MYINAGYFTNEDIDIEDNTLPLLVNSCGIYRPVHQEVMSTTRPIGRNDYQLLYVASGTVPTDDTGAAPEKAMF